MSSQARFGTVKALSAPKAQPRSVGRPTMTEEQKEEASARRMGKKADMLEDVQKWEDDTKARANQLGEKYNMKPRYFLDLHYSGGARLVKQREGVNSFNAFKSLKAEEINEGIVPWI